MFAALLLAAFAVVAWRLWPQVQERWLATDDIDAQAQAEGLRVDALESEIAALRQTVRQLERRIGDQASSQRVLREEVLGIGERAILVEQALAQLGEQATGADIPLRLDEVELLLHIGQQRLQLANDRDGALRAYVLANQLLAGIDDPAWISLRQSLGQELGALRALDEDPRDLALGALDAFEASLAQLRARHEGMDPPARDTEEAASGRTRLLDQLVRIRPSDAEVVLAPQQRELAGTVLAMEMAMARGAAERRDQAALATSIARIDAWLPRLYADTPALRERRAQLRELAERPLTVEVAVLGSTLQQLRAMRAGRVTGDEAG